MNSTFTILNILILLRKRRKEIALFTLAALVFSTISSFLITPKYKSEAVVYPINIFPYSVESQTEQMVQLMQSNYIMELIIKEFDLPSRYKIDMSKPGAKAKLVREYESNVSVEKTEFESVRLKVLDKDPQIACKIAKRIIALMNEKIRALQREKLREVVILNKNNFEAEKRIVDSLSMIRDTLRTKYHILDYHYQVKELYRGYLSGGPKSEEAKKQIRIMEKMGEIWDRVNHEYLRAMELYKYFKNEYEKTLYDSQKEITYANVVIEPFANDKRAYPIRWLIILSSTLSAFAFAIMSFIFIEFNPFKNLNREKN